MRPLAAPPCHPLVSVPSDDIVEPGAFILSSIWSVLEIESISELTVVLPQPSHLDALKAAMERRFGPGRVFGNMVEEDSRLVMNSNHIPHFRGAAFAQLSTDDVLEAALRTARLLLPEALVEDGIPYAREQLSSMLKRYLPSLPVDVSAEALASDFHKRVRAATPMSVVDPPYAPQRLKAPLAAAMERRGMAMQPMLPLRGGSPCRPSPSTIASAQQLMAILHKTGKHITGIELLYKATMHGFDFTDMLTRVADASCLLFLTRSNGNMHGCFIDDSIRPPPPPHQIALNTLYSYYNHYDADALIFYAPGPSPPIFDPEEVTQQCVSVSRPDIGVRGSLTIGRSASHNLSREEWLGLWVPDAVWMDSGLPGCVVRLGWGDVNEVEEVAADEVEVFTLQTEG
ncbi:unnamed protein product [Vitrella brassicaformis CCMP3155]|uniref:TLDc domain-containing protein n=1 Tax=Vitrella brassicaformis (strain CCMP3155) TaxID=1169540 RepID=A0A0G4GX37_VITBC|nr:unnamed protein product [Vitrella brassicaformis CCMP3155]|eukprot:CEM35583.1 unnamed protein product [Vitrella brassicaformis CCMP3155]